MVGDQKQQGRNSCEEGGRSTSPRCYQIPNTPTLKSSKLIPVEGGGQCGGHLSNALKEVKYTQRLSRTGTFVSTYINISCAPYNITGQSKTTGKPRANVKCLNNIHRLNKTLQSWLATLHEAV